MLSLLYSILLCFSIGFFFVQCVSPVSFHNIIPSRQIFDTCQRLQLSDQTSDIFPQILLIVIRMQDLFKIMPTRTYLFSNLNKIKPIGKQITDACPYMYTVSGPMCASCFFREYYAIGANI